MENKDVSDACLGGWWVFFHVFWEGFFGFVAVVVVGDAIDVAAVGFAPACTSVSWQVVDEACAVEGVEDGAGYGVGCGVVGAVDG